MLAGISKNPFDDKDWIFEIKWDGYRAITEIEKGEIKFYSRNGIDFSQRFPAIFQALKKIKHDVILDGEVVLLNEKNLPDFQKLQHYETNLNYPLIYYVFDILELNGKNMEKLAAGRTQKDIEAIIEKKSNDSLLRSCGYKWDSFFGKSKRTRAGRNYRQEKRQSV